MMNLFKNNKTAFEAGQIYKMEVGPRPHVKNPYYIEIIKSKPGFIVTNIPGHHQLEIREGENWEYHIPRMKYVGTKETHGHLILNQDIK